MTDIAIRVEGLGKLYRVGEPESHQHLRDVLANALAFRSRRKRKPPQGLHWAIRDVSFSVR